MNAQTAQTPKARPHPVPGPRDARPDLEHDGGVATSPASGAMTRIVRTYPVLSFFLLACLFGWILYLVDFMTGGSGHSNLPLGPLPAALIVASCQGRAELRSWGRRLRNWRASPRWYLLAVLAPLVVSILIVLANHGLGAPLPMPDQLADAWQVPINFVIVLVIVGIGEESGWTAFAAPILLRRHSLLVAWALASTIRILWHLPIMLTGDLAWVLGTVGNAAFTMVTLLLLTASGGHWTLAAVWHAMLNASGSMFFFTMVSGEDKARLGFLMAGAYVVVATAAYLVWASRLRPRQPERVPSAAWRK